MCENNVKKTTGLGIEVKKGFGKVIGKN